MTFAPDVENLPYRWKEYQTRAGAAVGSAAGSGSRI
jgi:hypothetical protein